MKRFRPSRRRVFLPTVLLLSAAALWLLLRPPPEPFVQGKPFTHWMRGFHGDSSWPYWKDEYVVRQVGTNAIPTLLRMIQAEDPAWKLRLMAWLQEHRFGMFSMDNSFDAIEQRDRAKAAFRVLGDDAKSAVPTLISIYSSTKSAEVRSAALAALGGIGPAAADAVPLLMHDWESSGSLCFSEYWAALRAIHSRPDLVVPRMIAALTNIDGSDVSNRDSVFPVIDMLGVYGEASRPAIPYLLPLVSADSPSVSTSASAALAKIHAEPDRVIPALTEVASRSDMECFDPAVEALITFGTDARPAIPTLTRLLTADIWRVRAKAAGALLQIAPPESASYCEALRHLHVQLRDTNAWVRVDAAVRILSANQQHSEAQNELMNCLKSADHKLLFEALCNMRDTGPMGRKFIPILIELLDNSDYEGHISELAEINLRNIDPHARDQAISKLFEHLK